MKTMSAREAKNGFGLMIDTARPEPVLIEKHGHGMVVVVSVEEYERLSVQLDARIREKRGPRGRPKVANEASVCVKLNHSLRSTASNQEAVRWRT